MIDYNKWESKICKRCNKESILYLYEYPKGIPDPYYCDDCTPVIILNPKEDNLKQSNYKLQNIKCCYTCEHYRIEYQEVHKCAIHIKNETQRSDIDILGKCDKYLKEK